MNGKEKTNDGKISRMIAIFGMIIAVSPKNETKQNIKKRKLPRNDGVKIYSLFKESMVKNIFLFEK